MAVQLLRTQWVGSGWNGAPGLMTHYWQIAGGATPGTGHLQEALNRVHAYLTDVSGVMAGGTLWTPDPAAVVIQDSDGQVTAVMSITTPPDSVPSTTPSAAIVPDVVMAIHRHITGTLVGNRILRGRSFFGPLAGNAVTQDEIPGATRTAMVAALDLLQVQVTVPLEQAVWSRPRLLPTPRPGSSGTVSSHEVPPLLGILRSRRD